MDKPKPLADEEATTRKTEGDVKHVVRTGLPPGVNFEDVKDPGKNAPKGPTNRS